MMPLASVAPVEVVLQPAKARAAARIPAKYFFCTALILDTPKAKVQMLELVSSLTLFFFALRRPPGPKIKTNIHTILRATGLNPPAKNGTQAKANLRLQPAASGGGGSKPSKHGFPFGQPCRPRESIGPNLKPKLRTYAAGDIKANIRCAELGFRPIHFTRNLGTIRFTAQSVSLGSALRGIRFDHHHREPQLKQTPNQEPQGYAAHVLSLVFIFRQDLCPGRASPQI